MANRNFTRAMRRKTQWAGFGDAAGAANLPSFLGLTAGTARILSTGAIIGNAAGFVEEEVTITRTIGRFTFGIDSETAEAVAGIAVGLAVVRNEAAAAGVGSLPSPEDDPDFEWLYYTVVHVLNPVNALQDGPTSSGSVDFDVRGQRILRSGQTLVWIAEANDTNCRAAVGGRYLAKLT